MELFFGFRKQVEGESQGAVCGPGTLLPRVYSSQSRALESC